MSTFENCIGTVLRHEGGLVDHKSDPGGVTNFGVSLRWALSEFKISHDLSFDVDGDGDVDADDIKKLTKDKASELYKKFWWDRYRYDRIVNDKIATKVFDMAVNMGPSQSHKIVQSALIYLGKNAIVADGKLGPMSIMWRYRVVRIF